MAELHVVFGSGPLGQAAVKALVKRGRQVRVINRSGKAELPAGVELIAGDAYALDFTRRVTADAAVVYQCSAPAYHDWVEKFPPLQASILEGVAAAGAKLIVAENLYMYGAVNGEMHEDLPYAAQTRKGKVRGQMSEELLAAHRSGKVRVAMARGSDFFGPGVLSSALGDRALGAAIQGKTASLNGKLDLAHSFTYIDDFGEALAVLGERDEALGQAWHVPNAPTLTQREIMGLFFQEMGLPPKIGTIGRGMMALAGLFLPDAGEMVEMMYEFDRPFVVDSGKFSRAFGDIATPYARSIPPTVEWYRRWARKGK